MNVTFACPSCEQTSRAELSTGTGSLDCPHCGQRLAVPAGAVEGGTVSRCLTCPSTDLFIRKDFPQRLGVGIVVLGIVVSTITWGLHRPILTFGVLFFTALVDLALYLMMPDALMCYRCGAMYRGLDLSEHEAFSLETHERYRQQAARLQQQKEAAAQR